MVQFQRSSGFMILRTQYIQNQITCDWKPRSFQITNLTSAIEKCSRHLSTCWTGKMIKTETINPYPNNLSGRKIKVNIRKNHNRRTRFSHRFIQNISMFAFPKKLVRLGTEKNIAICFGGRSDHSPYHNWCLLLVDVVRVRPEFLPHSILGKMAHLTGRFEKKELPWDLAAGGYCKNRSSIGPSGMYIRYV